MAHPHQISANHPSINSRSRIHSPPNPPQNNILNHNTRNSTTSTSSSTKPSAVSYQRSTSHNYQDTKPDLDHTRPSFETKSTANSSPNHRRITAIAKLLQHSRNLHRKILEERQQNERATAQFHRSLRRLSSLSAQRATVQKSLHAINRQLKEYYRQAPLYDRTLNILNAKAGAAILEINRLRTSKYSVMHEKAILQDHFRHRGLGAWVQKYIKGAVNPLVAGAVVEGTANVVEPMLDGIEKLADINDDLAKRMADQLSYSVPIVEKPFYAGVVTYTVLLLPLVLVTSILLKIKRGMRKFSIGHCIILGNFYFTLLSGGCFFATLLGKVDVLQTFRHVNLGMFDMIMVLHGLLYMVHVALHISMAVRSRDKSLGLHTLLLGIIGSHFFIHSYLHAMRNEDPHVDTRAYAVYTGVFAFILYTWTVKHIRTSMERNSMKLNNKSIMSCGNEEFPHQLDKYSSAVLPITTDRNDFVPADAKYGLPAYKSRPESCLRDEGRAESVLQVGSTVSKEHGAFARITHASGLGPGARTTTADDPKDL